MSTIAVDTYWINTFLPTTGMQNLLFCDEHADGFVKGLTTTMPGLPPIASSLYAEASPSTSFHPRLNSSDFTFFASHGRTETYGTPTFFAYFHDGTAWRPFHPTLPSNNHEHKLGEPPLGLKWLAICACDGLSLNSIPAVWGDAIIGIHLIFGFDGPITLTGSVPWASDRLGYNATASELFGYHAKRGLALGAAWLEAWHEMNWCRHPPESPPCSSNSFCASVPVILAAAATKAGAIARRDNETLMNDPRAAEQPPANYLAWKWRDHCTNSSI